MMNKISVIIPMYNAEKTIEELLTNLSEQSFSNVEYIIVDDGSEDNSFSMVDNYIKKTKDKKIRAVDEYWGDDGKAPKWRADKKIGTEIRQKTQSGVV